MNNTEQRLQTLEDIEAIRRLKARYCAACDDDHNPATLVTLFHPDAVWEATSNGRFEGHEAIRGFFSDLRASGRIRRSVHNVFNPDIEVDGNQATGHWRLLMLYSTQADNGDIEHHRIIGYYRERYRREDDEWRYESLFCQVEEHATYLTTAAT